ncbi:MAG TPA: aspartate aminotransferase family protein [Thermoanaerobaculia bacterium]|nr:aspartate aminotransferase family protein [Thermoanaerobaculia bacterium]
MVAPPGPRSRQLVATLGATEAPGTNTVGAEPSVVWAEAVGANVLDVDGNRYVDLTSGFGVAAVGHRHPRVVAAIQSQAARLVHGLGDVAAHPARVELGRRLQALAPMADARVYFAVSGSDAVEIAWRTAALATGRAGALAFAPAYHGTSVGALGLTSRPSFREPFAAMIGAPVHRLPFACAAAAIDAVLDRHGLEIGCVVFEPIAGREGVLVPPVGWLSAVAERCRAHGVLVVADEILTGFGRTGALWVAPEEGVEPDLVCCGKALGGGLPIAAVLGRADLLAAWDRPGEALHTGTFLAHPLACAAALATLDVIDDEALPARARALGARIEERARRWRTLPVVTDVRGRGLFWGIELRDRDSALRAARAALSSGLLLLTCGAEGRTLQLLPPLNVAEEQLAIALDLVEVALCR